MDTRLGFISTVPHGTSFKGTQVASICSSISTIRPYPIRRGCSVVTHNSITMLSSTSAISVIPSPNMQQSLSSGVDMKYYYMPRNTNLSISSSSSSSSPSSKPPLVFIHGSFHSGWCWYLHYMPFFAALGYDCYAPCLRGTSDTPLPKDKLDPKNPDKGMKIDVDDHTLDIAAFLEQVVHQPCVLVGHSFGGMYVHKVLELQAGDGQIPSSKMKALSKPLIKAAALFSSVPPSGNQKMIKRFVLGRPVLAYDITRGFVAKQAGTDEALCRKLFFDAASSSGMDKQTDARIQDQVRNLYMPRFKQDSVHSLDVIDLDKKLPSKFAYSDSGIAMYLDKLNIPIQVVGATKDLIVDLQGVGETAKFYNVEPEIMDGLPHDIMLCEDWEMGAILLREFLKAKEVDPGN